MGVGTPRDIIEAIKQGVDLFDCVMPTRAGRFGRAFVGGHMPYLNIKNASFAESQDPLDPNCRCLACRRYSRAYLHHLFRMQELLGPVLLSLHNVTHYLDLMARARSAIAAGTFAELYRAESERWQEQAGLALETDS
jgi:queuine tRNA-ribosyltransferase